MRKERQRNRGTEIERRVPPRSSAITVSLHEIERGDETEKGDEFTEKEAGKERGDEIKKLQKSILQTQNLGRAVNKEGTEWALGREKSATIRETGRVPIIVK